MSTANKQGERMLEALDNGDHDRSSITYVMTKGVGIDDDFISNDYDVKIKRLNAQWRHSNGVLEIRFNNPDSGPIESLLEGFVDPDPVQLTKGNAQSILIRYAPYLKN